MTLYLLVFNGSNLIDKFFNLMAFSKKLLLKIKTKTSEYENALSIIILRMTHFTFQSQRLKTVVFHKVFSLSVIKYNILEKEDITIGEILMLEQKLKFIQEFSKLLMLMILQESFTIMKEFNLGEVNHTLKILSFSLDQWLK